MDKIMKKLQNPPREYRGVPFWSWNDKLDPEFLRWQIREMDRAGLGGYFMHARGGLETGYLSEEWMECIGACIDEGKKLGMNSWCYDEEGWPSGFAGGIVTGMGDACHVRWLEMEETGVSDFVPDGEVLGVYTLKEDNELQRLDAVNSAREDGKIIVLRHKSNPYYIDILNEKVIRAFIESTYEKYFERFGEEFGKGMPGFFTDEPQFSRGKIPWSYILPEKFMRKYGYDLLEVLPALFIACEGHEKIRYDFWALVSELYVGSFGKQIYEWCNAHHCKFTGHVMMEDSLISQMGATAGVMPFYEYMHIPGMDWLGRRISSPVIPKQVGSVANQLGKEFVLSEMFALCGWDVSLEELKWIAEWQYVNGVSLMCQHLEGYTLRGLRKRDYPPSLFYQQAWWDEYRLFNDYFARLGVLLTAGRSAAEVLLLHPIKSGWIAYDGTNTAALKHLDEDFVQATETLAKLHIDHHYGDETLIARHGMVREDRFVVGQCAYKLVVLPSMLTLDKSTAELLQQFIDNGGTVVSLGDFPILCKGAADESLSRLQQQVQSLKSGRIRALAKQLSVACVSVTENGAEIPAIRYQQRDLEDCRIYYLVSHDQTAAYNATVTLPGKGSIRSYTAESDETEEIHYWQEDGDTKAELRFLPMQSHILIFDRTEDGAHPAVPQEMSVIRPGPAWDIEAADLNALTLDYCRYSIDGGEWTGPVPVIKLMGILLELQRSCDIALKFDFAVDMDLGRNKEFFLAIETAAEFEIRVNGELLQYQNAGWWKDSAFQKVDIKPYVKKGRNEIVLKRNFYQRQKVYDVLFGKNVLETERNKLTYDTELESMYVVGDFGVFSQAPYTYGERKAVCTDGPFVIADAPEKITGSDVTEQGFCFFAGAMKLSQELQVNRVKDARLLLDLGKPNAVISKVYVNGQLVKTLPWAPYTADITDFVVEGSNKLSVQLFSGNRNLLGPHHHVSGELYHVGPTSFTDKPGWADGNIQGGIWRDRYCFVKFGMEKGQG